MSEKKAKKPKKPKAATVNSVTLNDVTVTYKEGLSRGQVAQQLDRIKDQIMSR